MKKKKAIAEMMNLLVIFLILAILFSFLFYLRSTQKASNTKMVYRTYHYKYTEDLMHELFFTTLSNYGYDLSAILGYCVQYGNKANNYTIDISDRIVNCKKITNAYFIETFKDYKYYFYVDFPPGTSLKESIDDGGKPRLNACPSPPCTSKDLPSFTNDIEVHELLISLPLRNYAKAYFVVWK